MRFSKRRAVSQIIGTLMMVAIVASVGSVLMFQGIDAVQTFTTHVATIVGLRTSAASEDIIIEHVHMDANSERVDIYITNIGTSDIIIRNIKILKLDTQHLIVDQDMSELISIQERKLIPNVDADLSPLSVAPTLDQWKDSNYSNNKEYLISVSTTLGSSFQKAISPFNT